MKHFLPLAALICMFSSCVKDRDLPPITTTTTTIPGGGTLLHYWNFNGTSFTAPTFTIGGGNLLFDFTTVTGITGYADLLSPVTPNTNINAQNGDAAGNALRVRNPAIDLIIVSPTTGYKNIVVSFSVARSSTGAGTDSVYYSTDGVTYMNSGLAVKSFNPDTDPAYNLESFDFSAITAVNNNPNFRYKLVFANGNLATTGNDRFDNITVSGTAISGGTTPGNPPVVSGATMAAGTVGSVFAGYTITATNSPTSYSAVNLPPGLTVNSATGAISGTPTTAGVYIDTIKATNAYGTGSLAVTFTITTPVLSLLHYWNFNNTTSLATLIAPTTTIGGGALSFNFTGAGYYDSVLSTATQNAQNGNPAGFALRVRNPSVDLTITAPTIGYHNIILKYAVEASSASSAALTNTVSYTTDGTTYTSAGLMTASYSLATFIDPNYTLETFDFSGIAAANNNPNFKVKISFSSGNTNTSGNDRFDNITVQGYQ